MGHHTSSSTAKRASTSSDRRRPFRHRRHAALARAVAAAVPTHFEALEQRRLLAVDFTTNIIDPGGDNSEFYSNITRITEAAGADWGRFFNSNVQIELDIFFEFAPTEDFLAKAGSYVLEPIDESGDVNVFEVGGAHEIRTGTDPNGGASDGAVIFNTAFLDDLFFDPDTSLRTAPIPADEYDAYSLVLHELGHVIGFAALKDDFTAAVINDSITTYDQFVALAGPSNIVFTGPVATETYGQPVPLSLGSISHYGNPGGPGADLDFFLMSTTLRTQHRDIIRDIDLAILLDIGLPVIFTGGEQPPPPVPPTYDFSGTPKSDIIEVIYTGEFFLVTVTTKTRVQSFDPFTGLPIFIDEFETTRYKPFPAAGFTEVIIRGEGGHDRIVVNDEMIGAIIWGGDGNDTIIGGRNNDTIFGQAGNDQLVGRDGNDRLEGGGGDDYLLGGFDNDRLFGLNGHDILDGSAGDDKLMGGEGNDQLLGSRGNDYLLGEAGNDGLFGIDGRDRLDGGIGSDHLEGGAGVDSADYLNRVVNLVLTLDETANDGEAGEGDNITFSTENVWGGLLDDKISGNGANNVLAGSNGKDSIDGGSGNDLIEGGDGADVIDGMVGRDTLDGGAGNDRIQGNADADLIFGGTGNDRLFAVDRHADTLNGGSGVDDAEVDERDIVEDAGI